MRDFQSVELQSGGRDQPEVSRKTTPAAQACVNCGAPLLRPPHTARAVHPRT